MKVTCASLFLAIVWLAFSETAASAQCRPGYYCGPRTNSYRGIPSGPPSNIIRSRPVMGPMPVTTPNVSARSPMLHKRSA